MCDIREMTLDSLPGGPYHFHKDVHDGASGRRYALLSDPSGEFVVCSWQMQQFTRFLYFHGLYRRAGIAVPRLLHCQEEQKIIIQEYLQDRAQSRVGGAYLEDNLDALATTIARLQTAIEPRQLTRSFRRDLLAYEWQQLIVDRLLLGRVRPFWARLGEQLNTVFQAPEVPGHRDLQSSNIFLDNGRIYLIDFQDTMLCHPLYDIVSLVWDSYLSLTSAKRWQLAVQLAQRLAPQFCESELISVALQRKLHDLGAFLRALDNGKAHFSAYLLPTRNMIDELLHRLWPDQHFIEEIWQKTAVYTP
jgi:aminoglycoside/choline kinase family phosphotransferase